MDRWFWIWIIVVALFQFLEGTNGMDIKWSDSGVKVEKITEDTQKKPREPLAGSMSEGKDSGPSSGISPKGGW